jgi:hypothetical protein
MQARLARPTAQPPSGKSPAAQLAGFIAKFDPAIARLARAARRALRRRLPTALELVYDNYNALAMGFSPTERTSDCIVSLAVFPKAVSLFFYWGKTLPDPHKILVGDGNQVRYVRLESAATLAKPEVESLIRAAVAQAKVPLPRTGKGYTVIKSVSIRQRPRRPVSKKRHRGGR